MLLALAMLSLICALMAGVFGFEGATPSFPATVDWARYLFVPFLCLSAAAFTGGTLGIGRRRSRLQLAMATSTRRKLDSLSPPLSGTPR